MKIIRASYEILSPSDLAGEGRKQIYRAIEQAGRTCYKSEANITDDSAAKFVKSLVESGHEAMLEHASMTVRFIVDRGITHEIVRHRVASFAQESSRYCNYSQDRFGGEITFIKPCYLDKETDAYRQWECFVSEAESAYFELLNYGLSPQEARAVLPTSTKSELVMTANMREWRHFLSLRAVGTTGRPHPQMLEVTVPLLNELAEAMPELFGDLLEVKP